MPSESYGGRAAPDDVPPEYVAARARSAIYMRAAGNGPPMLVDEGTQAAVLEQYILDHGLWNTRGYFDSDTDDLTPLGERRQGALLLADAERGLFDVVVIATPSCLSRSLDVIADTIARLAIAGVGLRVAAGDPDE